MHVEKCEVSISSFGSTLADIRSFVFKKLDFSIFLCSPDYSSGPWRPKVAIFSRKVHRSMEILLSLTNMLFGPIFVELWVIRGKNYDGKKGARRKKNKEIFCP